VTGRWAAPEEVPSAPRLEDVRAAARTLRGVARRTPLLDLELPESGRRVWLKCESLQHGGAFKLRGAYHFVSRLPPEAREKGLVTYSSGNHAQGVAWAARAFGVPALIVMPVDAPEIKVEGTRRLGGRVVREGTTTTERRRRAEEIVRERGGTIVPPFDHPHVVAGQGTAALEALEQLRGAAERREDALGRPGLVLVPVGGGGLIAGHVVALAEAAPDCRVVGVEPTGAASMWRSLEVGRPVTLEEVDTVADGLKPVRPGELNFQIVREAGVPVVRVDDHAIREAMLCCWRRGLVAEPSGAATVAALLTGAVDLERVEGDVVAVVSGRNVDPGLMADLIFPSRRNRCAT